MKRFLFTKKAKQNKFNKKVEQASSNSDKLELILSEIKSLKSEFSDFRDDFNKYKKQDSLFQETSINNFILSLLQRNKNTYNTILIPIENVYGPYSINAVTELDGLILHTPTHSKMPIVSPELVERVDPTFQATLKDNISQINTLFTQPQLIIVESKRSLSKSKVDTKLAQIFEFVHILRHINTVDLTNAVEPFKQFIAQLMQFSELPLRDLQHLESKLIFGSDDIPFNVREYILAIYNGIGEDEYYRLCGKMFYEDKNAVLFVKNIVELETTPKDVKSLLKNYKTFDELRKSIHTHFSEYDLGYIAPYFTPYAELEHFFTSLKGSVGIVQFNKAILPSLFQYSNMY